MSLEADIAAALDSDDATQLRAAASSANWSTADATLANRVLQRIARYGCSGRTQRYRDVVDAVLAAGVVPSLSTCALLQANDLAERILADARWRFGKRTKTAQPLCITPPSVATRPWLPGCAR